MHAATGGRPLRVPRHASGAIWRGGAVHRYHQGGSKQRMRGSLGTGGTSQIHEGREERGRPLRVPSHASGAIWRGGAGHRHARGGSKRGMRGSLGTGVTSQMHGGISNWGLDEQ